MIKEIFIMQRQMGKRSIKLSIRQLSLKIYTYVSINTLQGYTATPIVSDSGLRSHFFPSLYSFECFTVRMDYFFK